MLTHIPYALQVAAFWLEVAFMTLTVGVTLYRLFGGADELKPAVRALTTAWYVIATIAGTIVLLLAHQSLT